MGIFLCVSNNRAFAHTKQCRLTDQAPFPACSPPPQVDPSSRKVNDGAHVTLTIIPSTGLMISCPGTATFRQLLEMTPLPSGVMPSSIKFPKHSRRYWVDAYVTSNVLSKGETMTTTGQLPPCTNCRGSMNRAATETGATIKYQWRENGETQTWTATPRN
jgi:Pput_2613-like deaminase